MLFAALGTIASETTSNIASAAIIVPVAIAGASSDPLMPRKRLAELLRQQRLHEVIVGAHLFRLLLFARFA